MGAWAPDSLSETLGFVRLGTSKLNIQTNDPCPLLAKGLIIPRLQGSQETSVFSLPMCQVLLPLLTLHN